MELSQTQLLAVLQLSDSMFPTGAFAHSYGLETYVQEGRIVTAESLQAYLKTQMLHNLAQTDMLIVAEAMRAYHAADPDQLILLDERLTVARVAAESRVASTKVGRRLLSSALALHNDAILQQFQQDIITGRCQGHHPVVYGLAQAALSVEMRAALLAYGYTFVASQASAAIRLIPLGQTDAQRTIQELQPTIQQAVDIALRSTLDNFQAFVPASEIRAMQHAYLDGRLFMS